MSHVNEFPQGRVSGRIVRPNRTVARQRDFDPIHLESERLVRIMMQDRRYIEHCRRGRHAN